MTPPKAPPMAVAATPVSQPFFTDPEDLSLRNNPGQN
jgi:hypothetical protein